MGRFASCALASFGLLVTACAADDGAKGPVPLDELGTETAAMLCTVAMQCHAFESPADCFASYQNTLIDDIAAWVADGTTIYDPQKARECIDETTEILLPSCSVAYRLSLRDFPPLASCAAAIQGTVADGGACLHANQCISHLCDLGADCTMACCVGACVANPATLPPASIGESCADGRPCVQGGFCNEDALPSAMCEAEKPEGQPCTLHGECAFPGICLFDAQADATRCRRLPRTGEACDPDAFPPCDRPDNHCNVTSMTCVLDRLIGESCDEDAPCVGYAYCDAATSRCVEHGLAGADCDTPAGQVGCLGSLECLDGTCAFEADSTCTL